MQLWSVEHFLAILSSLLGGYNSKATPNPPKSDDKNGQEMFKWSELHSERSNFLHNPHFMTSIGFVIVVRINSFIDS
jgi:hypothetical protein